LRSRRFAEFLSFFNESERIADKRPIVIPDEVAKNQELAKEVLAYYRQNKDIVKVNPSDRKEMDDLAERAYFMVRQRRIDRLNELAHSGREFIQDLVTEHEDYDTDIPDWIRKIAPGLTSPIPIQAARDLEKAFQRWYPFCFKDPSRGTLGRRVLAMVMNNFRCHFIRNKDSLWAPKSVSGEKIGTMASGYGPKMAAQSWEGFYAEIDQVLEGEGLSAEALNGMDQIQSCLYLLPVFLELLNRGYQVYPDLTR